MSRLLLTILCLYCLPLAAQDETTEFNPNDYFDNNVFDIYWDHKTRPSIITTDIFYQTSSDALTVKFINTLLWGGYVDNVLKDQLDAKLKEAHQFGLNFDNSLSFAHYSPDLFGMGEGIFYVNFKTRNHIDARFSADLLRFALHGNKMFENDSIDISGLSINRWRYNQLQVAFKKLIEKESNRFEIGLGLSYLQGINHLNVEVENGKIFTAADGEYLDVDLNFTANYSDSNNLRNTTFNGNGFATDLSFAMRNKNYGVKLNISDIGWLTWIGQAGLLAKDTSLRFRGIEVENVLNFGESVFEGSQQDSLLANLNMEPTVGSYTKWLPMKFYFVFTNNIPSAKTRLSFGTAYRIAANYQPLFFLKANYMFSPAFSAALVNSYGGYTRYALGIEANAQINNRFYAIAGAKSLQGWVMPASGTAASVYVRLGLSF